MSGDHQFYIIMSENELSECNGINHVKCLFNKPMLPVTSRSCILSLFTNNKNDVKSMCDFRFVKNTPSSNLHELDFNTLLVYRTPILNLECAGEHKILKGCEFCLLDIPCQCSIISSNLYLPPRHMKCNNVTKDVSVVHPFNLVLLQHFFDAHVDEHMFADSTFPKQINLSIPSFNLYTHAMHQILARDDDAHLNLSKMVAVAKQDSVAFQSLTEPLLDGLISIDKQWPDLKACLIFATMSTAIFSTIIAFYSFCKMRKLAVALLILQQVKMVKSISTEIPSFIYKPVTSEPVVSEAVDPKLLISWDHVLFLFSIINIAMLCINIWKFSFWQKHSNLMLEITPGESCLFVPLIKLPFCATYCQVNLPSDVSCVHIVGPFYNPKLSLTFIDFNIANNFDSVSIKVPSMVRVSLLQSIKLRAILKKPFFVFIYVQHSGFLSKLV